MSKLSKSLYLLVILLLAFLALQPYWRSIRDEAEYFYATWQEIRKAEDAAPEKAPPKQREKAAARERSIASPKPVAESAPPADRRTNTDTLDPFIREARQRAEEDPASAMQWLQEQSIGAERLRGMLEVVAVWAAKDSESALLWLESNAQGIARLETLNSGVEMWAQRDPEAAAGWIDGMANDQSKVAAAKSLASTWVRKNPGAAAGWVDGLPNGPIRDEAASALALAWMESDTEGAAEWAQREAIQQGNEQILDQVIRKYTGIAPEEAEAFARNLSLKLTPLQSSAIDTRYFEKFVEVRAQTDPAGTAEWLEGFQKSDRFYKPEYAKSLMASWTETDSIAASAWLSEQAAGPQRDAAIIGFSESIQRFEPEAAATWADTISDPNQRTEHLTKTLRAWADKNDEQALDWLIRADLEPALQEQLAREIGEE